MIEKTEETNMPHDTISTVTSREYGEAVAASLSNSLSSLNRLTNYEGATVDGWMSTVRRNFCVFVLFDLLLVSFIWLILAMLCDHGSLHDVVNNEIIHYSIQSSLFDMVILAMGRFAVLLLFYGYLRMNSKFFVASTTAATCAFLISKVIYFDWNSSNQTALQGTALLVSFILSWMEAWFIDWRVLPKEQLTRDAIRSSDDNQRLVRDYCQQYAGVVNDNLRRVRHEVTGEANASHFYTPIESHNVSDDENCENPDEAEWMRVADSAVRDMTLVIDLQSWTLVQRNDSSQVSLITFQKREYFKLELLARAPIDSVRRDLFENIDSIKSWNKSLDECSRVTKLSSECYDILYQVTKKMLGVSQRDMIIVRRCGKIKNLDAVCFASIEHPNFPTRHDVVRAVVHPSCWTIREHPAAADICEIIGYLSLDLKLALPKAMAKNAFAKSLLDVAAGIHDLIERNKL